MATDEDHQKLVKVFFDGKEHHERIAKNQFWKYWRYFMLGILLLLILSAIGPTLASAFSAPRQPLAHHL
jgi:hypothetical protein